MLRDAGVDDLPWLLQIEAQFPGDRLSRRQFRHHLRRGAPLRVIVDPDGVAGYHLVLLRRGSRLLADAECCAIRRGADRMTLEVRADNRAAIGLYRRHGYAETGQRPRYYDDGETALCMQRSLLSRP